MPEKPPEYSQKEQVVDRRIVQPVPFFKNTSDRCLPASVHAILTHFLPQIDLDEHSVDALCGYTPGNGAWKTQCLLGLASLGFDVLRIEDDDMSHFAHDPLRYMETRFPDTDTYNDQLAHSNIPLEAARTQQYLNSGLPFEYRQGTRQDIEGLLCSGWLVQAFINGPDLFTAQDPPIPHVVLAVGFSEESIILHNPDSVYGNVPFQEVPWETFERAWDNHPSGVKGLSAFRWNTGQLAQSNVQRT